MDIEKAKRVLFNRLSQMREGITNYRLLHMIRFDDQCIEAIVSYTWHLNGHAKPADRIKVSLIYDKQTSSWMML